MENVDEAIALAFSVKVVVPVLLGMPVAVTAADYLDHGRGSGRGRPFCVALMLSVSSAFVIFTLATVFFDLTLSPITAKSGWPVLYVFAAIPWLYLIVLRQRRLRLARRSRTTVNHR